MQFRITCKTCGTSCRVTEQHINRIIRCPKCETKFRVPPPPSMKDSDSGPDEDDSFNAPPQPRRPESRRSPTSKQASRSDKPSHGAVLIAAFGGVAVTLMILFAGWLVMGSGTGRAIQQETVRTDRPAPATANETQLDAPQSQEVRVATTGPAAGNTKATPAPVNATVVATKSEAAKSPDTPDKKEAPKSNPAASSSQVVSTASISKSQNSTETPDLAELIDRASRSVVLIRLKDANGQEVGLGSGFIVNKDGLIATNFHVMKSAITAEAEFRDGTTVPISGYRAYDDKRDIAIIELENPPGDLQALETATGADIRQGSAVVAIGHPRGLRFTATEGIVSAIHKTSDLPADLRKHIKSPDDQIWIQTNATIFPGNSGGPLLTRAGKVLGINSWITTDVNFGFALAIQHLIDLESQIKEAAMPLAEVNRQGSIRDSKAGLGGTIDAKVQAVLDEYQRSIEEFNALMSTAKSRSEQQKLVTTKNPARRCAPQMMKIANDNQKTPTAYQALYFAVALLRQYYPESTATSLMQQATSQLLRDHVEEKSMAKLALMIGDSELACVPPFLRELIQRSPDRDTQAVACLVLGRSLGNNGSESARTEAITVLERVVNEFSDVLVGDKPIIESAQRLLFGLLNLSVGGIAPDIVGKDADGNELKLSDFRGKVVMLDFFADWCPHCVKMYPLERILVEQSRNQPCVLLGVNCDKPGILDKIIREKKVTWKCWADGEGGPIGDQYQVGSYPQIFLIDHEGIIRYKFVGAPDPKDVDKALRLMIKKAVDGKEKSSNTTRKPRTK